MNIKIPKPNIPTCFSNKDAHVIPSFREVILQANLFKAYIFPYFLIVECLSMPRSPNASHANELVRLQSECPRHGSGDCAPATPCPAVTAWTAPLAFSCGWWRQGSRCLWGEWRDSTSPTPADLRRNRSGNSYTSHDPREFSEAQTHTGIGIERKYLMYFGYVQYNVLI